MTTGKVVPSYVYNEFDREIIIDSYNPDQLTLISNERDDNGWEDSLPFTSVETIDASVRTWDASIPVCSNIPLIVISKKQDRL